MSDWSVLGLGGDPTPGDPAVSSQLAARLRQEAQQARTEQAELSSIAASDGNLRMAGDYAPKYRDVLSQLPVEMGKQERAFQGCGDAMAVYASRLAEAKSRSGLALRQGEDADARYQAAIRELRSVLPAARGVMLSSGLGLEQISISVASVGLDPAAAAQAQAAATRARGAQADREAARSLADQASALRQDAEGQCVQGIQAALDGSGIKDKPWYEKAWDTVSAPFTSWDDFVDLVRTVAIVAGTVALFISGPIGLALVAIALVAGALVLANTVNRYANGQASLAEVGLDALGVIPGEAGAANLLRLGRGALGLAGELASGGGRLVSGAVSGLRELAPSIRGTLGDLRTGAVAFVKRVLERDPIDVATGDMVLQQVDLELPGILPLVLSRTHVSSYRAGRWFGRSWASTLDQRLEVDGGGVFYAGEDGVLLSFRLPADGTEVQPEEGQRWRLTRHGNTFQLQDPAGARTLLFGPVPGGDPGVLPLTAISERNGHRIDLTYDVHATLTGLRHSGGYAVGVDSAAGLITGLRLLGADRAEDQPLIGYDYDASGRLIGVVNSSGMPLRFDYDATGRIIAWHDRIGTTYRYRYDARGRCVATSGSAGCLAGSLRYDDEQHTTTVRDSLGHTRTFELNPELQVIRVRDALGQVEQREWDRYDRLLAHTDALGARTRYEYDQAGDLTGLTRPDGSRLIARYDAARRPVEIVGPDGARWLQEYDADGNLLSVTDPAGARTRYGYGARGCLVSVHDAVGGVSLIETDAAGLPIALTDPEGATVRYSRDGFGRIIAVSDALGATTTCSWTVEGRPASRTLPSGAREVWAYDAEGNCIEHVDPEGRSTRVDYTHFDLPAAHTGPDGARRVFCYDTELRLVAITDPAGQLWRYEYDAAGRMVAEVDLNGRALAYRFDAAGRLVEQLNGAGQSQQFTRDLLGRVVGRTTAQAQARFEYDAAGRLVRALNPDADLRLEYDPVGRLVAETCNGRRLTSTYDPAGRRVARRTPSGAGSSWGFAAGSRPVSLQAGSGQLEFGYDRAGREVRRSFGELVALTQCWTEDGRISAQQLSDSTRTLVQRTYRYHSDGLLSDVHTGGSETAGIQTVFELDQAGRVVAARSGGASETYAYDGAGRPRWASWPGADAAAPGEREYSGSRLHRAGASSYEYDAQGRITIRRSRTLSGRRRTWIYSWDPLDRLTGVRTPDGEHWRYRYDPLGRRIAKERLQPDGAVAERVDYTWDGVQLAEQAGSGQRPGLERVTTWDWAPGGYRPVGQRDRVVGPQAASADDGRIDEQFHAIVADLLGAPSELVDAGGTVAWRSAGSLWGAPTGAGSDGVTGRIDCPLRFPGQYADPETGLHYNYFRYYDPGTGRYLSPDPIGLAGGPDPHAYVSNPLQVADPLGLAPYDAAAGGSEGTISVFKASQPTLGEQHYLHGYSPGAFPGNGAYFARQQGIADTYAVHYGEGVIETKVPVSVYEEHLAQFEMEYLGSPPGIELAVPGEKLDLLSQFERFWHQG